jgi:hypothetical protein
MAKKNYHKPPEVAGLDFEATLSGATTADEAMEGLEGLS